MGKGRPRAIEKGVLGQSSRLSSPVSLDIPPAPVYYPNEEEFNDPLEYISKIRPEVEPYGICKIVPPKGWKPPFALNLDSFTFPTKTQAIHQLQARPASCDPKTFELEYNRFLEDHCGRKSRKKIVFEGEELDLCKLFNAVKRFGGYDKAVKDKKWAEIYRFVRPSGKISECAKHVLTQLYREHLYDYEEFYKKFNKEVAKSCKRSISGGRKSDRVVEKSNSKKRRKNNEGEKFKVSELEVDDQICEQCKSGLHGEVMLLCDRCDKGWHIYCLSPPSKQVPLGNWYCYECLNSDKDSFGFVPGKRYSIEAFRRVAERAKRKWFGSVSASRVEMEKRFWEIVEGSLGEVEVMYGSDLDTSLYGSGFPRINDQKPKSVDDKLWDQYCTSPWNLNNLPKLKGSMLRAVHHSIAGVMVPWLYIGMLFSAFCWHFEDHCFYSMNYHHWGEPKCWYSIPGSEASSFEKVMRNTLPDLFDAQPDLLFQLITMLNPSVLQKNGVPVYTVLQEPGNFVITFPRSYHGGFNFGLNCAEAVNFAPADWLPHGGFGAELYKLYHKAPVLSHEELLCVAAKSNWDGQVSPYLKEELLKMYTKEKNWREKLWRNGIVKSSPMCPRKCPEYVGTEEDPTCIICMQYLYLSAVICRCRPSTYVCLEHWEHLCECSSCKRRLLYRHTLAELRSLVHKMEYHDSEEESKIKIMEQMTYNYKEAGALTKKTKQGQATMAQLAEQWILRSSEILQEPFSVVAYNKALKEAEQYLWAGSEMDPVRDVTRNLIEAKTWAEGIKACILKIEIWSSHRSHNDGKMDLIAVEKLLNCCPLPCNEPKYIRLKEYAEEAKMLKQEIDAAISTCLNISEMELLYAKASDFPIHVKESEKLAQKISSAKVWVGKANKCLLDKHRGAIELDFLYKLKSEISELQVKFPETEILLDLLRQVESYQAKCSELLRSPLTLKIVEELLQELDTFTVDFPEIKILRQHYNDAVSWISHFKDFMVNIEERKDQERLIDELTSIMKDGKCLRISVDELSLAEIELRKACCRGKALKMRGMQMSLEFVQQVILEASVLQIEKEKLFVTIADVYDAAMGWEERAKRIFASERQISEFDDLLRTSEDICVILPSLADVKNAVSAAKSWLERAKPFLDSNLSIAPPTRCFLKVIDLKELVSESKLLKVSLKAEYRSLETVLMKCEKWGLEARSLLQEVECLSKISDIGDGGNYDLISKIEHLLASLKAIIKSGLSLGFDFDEIPKLQNACSFLQWCNKVFSFFSVTPSLEEVEGLMEVGKDISVNFSSGFLWSTLFGWVQWVKKAVGVLSISDSGGRCKLSEAEDILAESQNKKEFFAPIIGKLAEAIGKHKEWQEEVQQFFSLQSGERNWSSLVRFEETGKTVAFGCLEWDMVISEVRKVENWMQCCKDIFEKSVGDLNSLLGAIQKVKQSTEKSIDMFESYKNCTAGELCICCFCILEEQKYVICSACKSCYHLQCLGDTSNDPDAPKLYQCYYCQIWESGLVVQIREGLTRSYRKHPDLKKLIELLEDSKEFYARIDEKDELEQLVERAIAFKACLTELVASTSACLDKDLSIISKVIHVALKILEVTGLCDIQVNCDLELAVGRHCWRRRANNLLEGKQKPTTQQVKQLLKEGLAVDMPSEDYFWQKLSEMKHHGLQWVEYARKVSTDSGALSLDKVFDLILEGENLPVNVGRELKLLRNRSMLYCLCRKPYDQRAMIACDRCEEWYHFDCIKLVSLPKVYICPACNTQTEDSPCSSPLPDHLRLTSAISVEPKTPSPRYTKTRKETRNSDSEVIQNISDKSNVLRSSSGIDQLWWRNRKPFRRAAKKRVELESLSPFFPHINK